MNKLKNSTFPGLSRHKESPTVTFRLLCLTLTMLFASFVGSTAYALETIIISDGINYKVLDESERTCEVSSNTVTPDHGELEIPTTVSYNDTDYTVVRIGEVAFGGCSNLISIKLPNSVTDIGNQAFTNCDNLQTVNLSESVKSIDVAAFKGCAALTSITLPESVETIGESAFSQTGLTSITLSTNLTSIAASTFYNCEKLSSVTIQGRVTEIGSSAFYGCSGLESISIPEGVTSIGSSAFQNCSGLASIAIPDAVTNIGESAFSGCSALETLTIPDAVTNIGASAFGQCSSLKEITLPENVASIGNGAFSYCSNLISVNIPDNVTSIGASVFRGCTQLNTIKIPNAATSIGNYAFRDCKGLTSIELPESLETIGNYAFNNCKGLITIDLPDNVNAIGTYAFMGCSSLESIEIPNSVSSIESGTFEYCGFLNSVIIPESVKSINYAAFQGCEKLTNIEIPNSVNTIGNYAFDGCLSLTEITISTTLTSIGDYAFRNCANLAKIRYLAEEPITLSNNTFDQSVYENAKLIVSSGVKETAPWSNFTTICIPGDANLSGTIDIADATTIANHVVGLEVDEFDDYLADANGNGVITVSDALEAVTLSLEAEPSPSMAKISGIGYDEAAFDGHLILSDNLDIALESDMEFVALQADIYMPEGMTLEAVAAGAGASNHTVMHRQVGHDIYRVVLFNFDGVTLGTNGASLLSLKTSGNGTPILANIVASDSKGTGHRLSSDQNGTTAVDGINTDEDNISVYSTDGRLVRKFRVGSDSIALTPGIYIVTVGDRTNKIMIK